MPHSSGGFHSSSSHSSSSHSSSSHSSSSFGSSSRSSSFGGGSRSSSFGGGSRSSSFGSRSQSNSFGGGSFGGGRPFPGDDFHHDDSFGRDDFHHRRGFWRGGFFGRGGFDSGYYYGRRRPPIHRVSRRPGNNRYHYAYYNRKKSCYESYYYPDTFVPYVYPADFLGSIFVRIAAIILILFMSTAILLSNGTVFLPKQADSFWTSNTTITIEDQNHMISSTDDLYQEMEEFQEKTGITPAVEVLKDSDWENQYSTLSEKANQDYNNLCGDEGHSFIVVSVPDEDFEALQSGKTLSDKAAWECEMLTGNYVYHTLNATSEKEFREIVKDCLNRSGVENLGQGLTSAYDQFNAIVMRPQNLWILIAIYSAALAYLILRIPFIIIQYRRMEKCANAVLVTDDMSIAICPTCGLKYYAGTVCRCPACGTVLDTGENMEQNEDLSHS